MPYRTNARRTVEAVTSSSNSLSANTSGGDPVAPVGDPGVSMDSWLLVTDSDDEPERSMAPGAQQA
jgi:hypothetical protein